MTFEFQSWVILFFKPRLHERFFACDGDAILFFKLSRRQRAAENRLCSHPLTKSVILSQKIELIEFLAIFFLPFFQLLRHLCEGGYTCDFRRALAT